MTKDETCPPVAGSKDESTGKQQTTNNNDQYAAEPHQWKLQFVV